MLFDAEPEFVRAIELYQAGVPERAIDVYFLCYAESVEEQNYRTALARETDAFKALVEAKRTMALPRHDTADGWAPAAGAARATRARAGAPPRSRWTRARRGSAAARARRAAARAAAR